MRKYLVLIFLALNSAFACAAELTLFDIPLRTSSREEIRDAITQAGGKLKNSSRDSEKYDARAIGMPGATELEVVYLEDKMVMAQYSITVDIKEEERIRKMLVAKYGQPQGRDDFDGQYISDGKYRWNFDHSMELVFTKDFFSSAPKFLSYVNKREVARLGKLVNDADRRAAEKDAAKKKSVF